MDDQNCTGAALVVGPCLPPSVCGLYVLRHMKEVNGNALQCALVAGAGVEPTTKNRLMRPACTRCFPQYFLKFRACGFLAMGPFSGGGQGGWGVYKVPVPAARPLFFRHLPPGRPLGGGGVIKDCISPYTPQPRPPGDLMTPSPRAQAGGDAMPGCCPVVTDNSPKHWGTVNPG